MPSRGTHRDAEAFEAVYDAYDRLVFGIALRMLGEVSRAEDLTEAVFVHYWHSPDAFSGGRLDAMFSRAVRTMAIDIRSPGSAPSHRDEPAITNVAELESVSGRAEFVRSAVSNLPADQREALEAGFFDCATVDDIAERTGTSLAVAGARIRRALAALGSSVETIVRNRA